MNTRVRRDETAAGPSLKPYVAIVACAVVAGVVLFSLLERWTPAPVSDDQDIVEVVEGGGRVVIGRPSTPATAGTSAEGVTSPSSYKPEEFTFYKSLSNSAIPEPKLDPRPTASPPPAPKAASKVERGGRPQRAPAVRASYTVQVGSFQDRKTADQLATRLRRRHHHLVSVKRIVLPDTSVRYRVRVGEFKTRQGARQLADLLKTTEKLSPFVASVATDPSR